MPFITRAKNVVVMTVEEERAPEKADRLVRSSLARLPSSCGAPEK